MASDAERTALKKPWVKAWAMCSSLRTGCGHWSWWDYHSGAWNRDSGWRIDHIYRREDLLDLAQLRDPQARTGQGTTQRPCTSGG